jgi:hypothetical protein
MPKTVRYVLLAPQSLNGWGQNPVPNLGTLFLREDLYLVMNTVLIRLDHPRAIVPEDRALGLIKLHSSISLILTYFPPCMMPSKISLSPLSSTIFRNAPFSFCMRSLGSSYSRAFPSPMTRILSKSAIVLRR